MLERMGYIKQNQMWYKAVGNYRIYVIESGNSYVRRITKNGQIYDIRKVVELEKDEIFINILKEIPKHKKIEEPKEEVVEVVQEAKEVDIRTAMKLEEMEEQDPGFIEDEVERVHPEIKLR